MAGARSACRVRQTRRCRASRSSTATAPCFGSAAIRRRKSGVPASPDQRRPIWPLARMPGSRAPASSRIRLTRPGSIRRRTGRGAARSPLTAGKSAFSWTTQAPCGRRPTARPHRVWCCPPPHCNRSRTQRRPCRCSATHRSTSTAAVRSARRRSAASPCTRRRSLATAARRLLPPGMSCWTTARVWPDPMRPSQPRLRLEGR